MYDAIEYRGFSQSTVEILAEYSGVPVFNGLTDEFHPTQMLADVLTMLEHARKPIHEISYAYVGDGRNNVANSLLLVGAKLGTVSYTHLDVYKRQVKERVLPELDDDFAQLASEFDTLADLKADLAKEARQSKGYSLSLIHI